MVERETTSPEAGGTGAGGAEAGGCEPGEIGRPRGLPPPALGAAAGPFVLYVIIAIGLYLGDLAAGGAAADVRDRALLRYGAPIAFLAALGAAVALTIAGEARGSRDRSRRR